MSKQSVPTKSAFVQRVTRERRTGAQSQVEARNRAANHFGFDGFKLLLASAKEQGVW